MLGGIFLSLFYGIIGIEWCKGEQDEQQNRRIAKKYNNPIYIDKWGHERYTSTGKRKRDVDYKRELRDDLYNIRKKYQNDQLARREKQINEIKQYKQKYNNNLSLYRDKYNLSFEEYFFATHKTSILFEYELFNKFVNIEQSDDFINKISLFRVKCKIRPKDYI